MDVKILSVIFFIFLSNSLFAQKKILLKKNNTVTTNSIRLPHKVNLVYDNDTAHVIIKGRAIKYVFPILTLIHKNDTLRIDVRRIEKLKYKSPTVVVLNHLGFLFFANICISTMILSIDEGPDLLAFSIPNGVIAYWMIRSAYKKYDTKTKWSFY